MKYVYLVGAALWTAVVVIVLSDGGYRELRVVLGGTGTCVAFWWFARRRWLLARNLEAEAKSSRRSS